MVELMELMEEVEGEEVEILFQALLQFLYSELNSMYKLECTYVQHRHARVHSHGATKA